MLLKYVGDELYWIQDIKKKACLPFTDIYYFLSELYFATEGLKIQRKIILAY